MTRVTDVIRSWLGLCPHGPSHKIRTFPNAGDPCQVPDKPSRQPAVPPVTATADSRSGYQENVILILLLLTGLFCLVDLKLLALTGIFSAILVYYDAQALHAGEKFEKESILGDVVTWRPPTWGLAVLIIPLIFLAIYVFSREEIFDANT